jgi:hypothetical protein
VEHLCAAARAGRERLSAQCCYPLPPYCCPYPCPHCTLTHSLPTSPLRQMLLPSGKQAKQNNVAARIAAGGTVVRLAGTGGAQHRESDGAEAEPALRAIHWWAGEVGLEPHDLEEKREGWIPLARRVCPELLPPQVDLRPAGAARRHPAPARTRSDSYSYFLSILMPDPFWVILPDQSREGGACWGAGPTGDITLGERRSISLKVLPNGRRSLAVRKHCTAVSETLSGKYRAQSM